MLKYDVIVTNKGRSFGVSVASLEEALFLVDTFANKHTEVEVFDIEIQSAREAAASIADFLKGLYK